MGGANLRGPYGRSEFEGGQLGGANLRGAIWEEQI